jgi:hypothetical protein
MRRFGWILAAAGGALVSAVALQGVAASAAPAAPVNHGHQKGHHHFNGSADVLKFDVMTPVTGPYVGAANPLRGENGGGFPWILKAGSGELRKNGRLEVRVRGLVLAKVSPVPTALQGTNPLPDFRALVSCQTIGTGNTATVTNVSTGNFKADSHGNAEIRTRIKLPHSCIAPIVFVTGPVGTDAWLAVTGG